jgi:hypothetical protein
MQDIFTNHNSIIFSNNERDDLREAAHYLSRGTMGGFAGSIGDAMLMADDANLDKLRKTFPNLVQEAWNRLGI